MTHGKKEGNLYMTTSSAASILVTSLDVDAGTWHHRLGHISEKVMKAMLSKGKLPELEVYHFRFM